MATSKPSKSRAEDRSEAGFDMPDPDAPNMGHPEFVEGQVRSLLGRVVQIRKTYNEAETGKLPSDEAVTALTTLIDKWAASLAATNPNIIQTQTPAAQATFLREHGFGDTDDDADQEPDQPDGQAGAPGTARHALHGRLSYYAHQFAGRPTANGERFDPEALTMAHRTLPFGTRVKVTRVDTGDSVVVRINDRGPFKPDRVIDLSEGAAKTLGMTDVGSSSAARSSGTTAAGSVSARRQRSRRRLASR